MFISVTVSKRKPKDDHKQEQKEEIVVPVTKTNAMNKPKESALNGRK